MNYLPFLLSYVAMQSFTLDSFEPNVVDLGEMTVQMCGCV